MIEKHKSVASVASKLLGMPDWRWLGAIPGDVLLMMLGPVAKVADWVVTERRDLLDQQELVIAVVGSPLDSYEGGALWSTLAPMLGKPAGWVSGSIQVNGGKPIGHPGTLIHRACLCMDEDRGRESARGRGRRGSLGESKDVAHHFVDRQSASSRLRAVQWTPASGRVLQARWLAGGARAV